ncbi:MAG: hypothetical protein WA131_12665, partial [Desulfitobacteriaceae bacterium]
MSLNIRNTNMKLVFKRACDVMLYPSPLYDYQQIVSGLSICGKTMKAVAYNTFQGYGRNMNGSNVQNIFIKHFLENEKNIIRELQRINTRKELNDLSDEVLRELYIELKEKTDISRLDSYNRIRKPIDLYMEHIVLLCEQISQDCREKIVPLLYLPLDGQMFSSTDVFNNQSDLTKHGLDRKSTYGNVKNLADYTGLQKDIERRAVEI